jgi:antitoxin (DNA-binding transcriptional repressor) of toxin-antitoxin stability system
MVRRGSEIQVTDRGVPVARLVRLEAGARRPTDDGRVERLAESGVLRRGSGDLSWLLDQPPLGESVDLGDALAEDREDRV